MIRSCSSAASCIRKFGTQQHFACSGNMRYNRFHMLIIIDNYDSFTYNLVQYLGELGAESRVHRNDEISIEEIRQARPAALVLSPGPCTPNEAGISMEITLKLAAEIPILGVCLGMQAMVQARGGRIVTATDIMHGKQSEVYHTGEYLFANLSNPFRAARYHSLVAAAAWLPDCFRVTAWTCNARGERAEIMGVRHKQLPLEGVQFHPESILTEEGKRLLRNFLDLSINLLKEKNHAINS